MYESSVSPHPRQHFVVWLFDPSHFCGCEMASHYGFDLHCPKDWCGEGNGTPLQYSCLETPMDGGAWWAAVHGVAEGRTRLSDFTFTFHFHALEKEMATYSSVLTWRIPGTGEPGGLPSMGLHRVGHDWSDLAAAAAAAYINGLMNWHYFMDSWLLSLSRSHFFPISSPSEAIIISYLLPRIPIKHFTSLSS